MKTSTNQVAQILRESCGVPPTGNRHIDLKRQVRRAMRAPLDNVSWVAARYQESIAEMRGKPLAYMIGRYARVAEIRKHNKHKHGIMPDPFVAVVFREVWLILRFTRRYGYERRYDRVVNWPS
jgi:hypothetical protein